jgi:hypothetical protein
MTLSLAERDSRSIFLSLANDAEDEVIMREPSGGAAGVVIKNSSLAQLTAHVLNQNKALDSVTANFGVLQTNQ